MLNALAGDHRTLIGKLDTYTKYYLYERELRRAGLTWRDLRSGLTTLTALRQSFSERMVGAVVAGSVAALPPVDHEKFADAERLLRSLGRQASEQLCFALRLQTLDTLYHELGGYFDDLMRAGHIDVSPLVNTPIEQAMVVAPPWIASYRSLPACEAACGQRRLGC